ncbi:MAG: hypothetical protein ABIR68_17130 [Ilumatobacteraceae bacterium]
MPATPDELLDRIAATLREQIGPNVGEPFAKTQAFMAAVILDKLAGQLRHAAADSAVADEQRRELVETLRSDDARGSAAALSEAIDALGEDGRDANWSRLVEALYTGREELGAERFERTIAQVRTALRTRLDRQLAYSA